MVDIRNGLTDTFTIFSQVFILLLMTAITLTNKFWVSFYLRPYHIPLFLRGAKTTEWHDRFRISNSLYVFCWLLSGCIPALNFIDIGVKCLHATNNDITLGYTVLL